MPHQVDPVAVNLIVPLHFGQNVQDVLFCRSAIHGSRVATLRTRHQESETLGLALQCAVTIEVEHRVFVAAHAMECDDQWNWPSAIVVGGHKETVGLQGLIHVGAVGFVHVLLLAGERIFSCGNRVQNRVGGGEFCQEIGTVRIHLVLVRSIVEGYSVFGIGQRGRFCRACLGQPFP